MPGIEPGTFHMQSERSTAELHPHIEYKKKVFVVELKLIMWLSMGHHTSYYVGIIMWFSYIRNTYLMYYVVSDIFMYSPF